MRLPIGTKVRILKKTYEFDKGEICTVISNVNNGNGSCNNYLRGETTDKFAPFDYRYEAVLLKNVIGGELC